MSDTTFTYKSTTITSDWANQANRYVFASSTAAGLRSLGTVGPTSQRIYTRARTLGYYSPGDGGMAEYYFDPTDTTSADNGGSVFVDQAGGRWKIAKSVSYSVLQFGAKGDGVTDDHPPFAAAVAALPTTGGSIYVPGGRTYLLNSTLTLPFPGHYLLYGDSGCEAANNVGPSEIQISSAVSGAGIYIDGPFSFLRDLVVRGLPGATATNIQIARNSSGCQNVLSCSAGQDNFRVGADTGTNINANNWILQNCRSVQPARYGLYIKDGTFTVQPNTNAGLAANFVAQSDQVLGVDGIRIDSGLINTFVGGTVENNPGCGIRFNGAYANYNAVIGLDFDSGNLAGKCRAEAGSTGNCVIAPTLFDTEVTDLGSSNVWRGPSSTPGVGYVDTGIGKIAFADSGVANDLTPGATSYLRIATPGATNDDAHAAVQVKADGLHLGAGTGGAIGEFGATPVGRSTGWGTPTGNVKVTNFPGATATLLQTSETLAQLLLDLKARGTLGA